MYLGAMLNNIIGKIHKCWQYGFKYSVCVRFVLKKSSTVGAGLPV